MASLPVWWAAWLQVCWEIGCCPLSTTSVSSACGRAYLAGYSWAVWLPSQHIAGWRNGMKSLKVLTVFGTRPEAIKMAPVIYEIQSRASVHSLVCVTGQHREMLDQVLGLFAITPDYDLDVMRPNQSPSQVAARVLSELDPLLESIQPDWVLVQGDTTTVMAASIAAHHRGVKVGHVEAGLRTHDRANPFPEEMNRVVTDHISDLHFAPTPGARDNLLSEGISRQTVFVTGNTAIDALQWVIQRPVPREVQTLLESLETPGSLPRSLILVTAHRRESFGQPIRNICEAIQRLASRRDVHLVYPVHRNPNVWHPCMRCWQGWIESRSCRHWITSRWCIS